MKKLKLIIITTFCLAITTMSIGQTINQEVTDEKGKKNLLGKCDRSGLLLESYKEWYTNNYESYEVNKDLLKKSKKKMKGVEVEIFMGTWCGDSKKEVPRFYKMMDFLDVDEENLHLVNLNNAEDSYKQSPTGEEKGKFIHRVPTFIFYKNGKELGRIVEFPVSSLEQDMVQILNGMPSTPNYRAVGYLQQTFEKNGVPTDNKELFEIAKAVYKVAKGDSELNSYGYLLLRRGEVDKAIATFTINVMINRNVPNVYDSLAEAYLEKGNKEMALSLYKKMLEVMPKTESVEAKIEELSAEVEDNKDEGK